MLLNNLPIMGFEGHIWAQKKRNQIWLYWIVLLKGTLSRDFWPLVFLLILFTLRPWLWGWNVFEKKIVFEKLFDYEVVRSIIGLLRKIFWSSPMLLRKFFGVVQYYSEKFLEFFFKISVFFFKISVFPSIIKLDMKFNKIFWSSLILLGKFFGVVQYYSENFSE